MSSWTRSSMTMKRMEGLVAKGLLVPMSDACEWIIPRNEGQPDPPDGYVVLFTAFHERGSGMPAHRFLTGLLQYYGLELQHLNLNGILHIAVFMAMCEGFLRIEPHFNLWRYFFVVNLQNRGDSGSAPIGCASIRLRAGQAREYISLSLPTSNKGWHPQWFYLRNTAAGRLPEFTGKVFERAPESWGWGVPQKEQTLLAGPLTGVDRLI